MTVKPGWEIPMNRQYLEYIPEIGTPAANSHHGQQQPLHQQPGCKAANPSDHHDVNACSSWADHVGRFTSEYVAGVLTLLEYAILTLHAAFLLCHLVTAGIAAMKESS